MIGHEFAFCRRRSLCTLCPAECRVSARCARARSSFHHAPLPLLSLAEYPTGKKSLSIFTVINYLTLFIVRMYVECYAAVLRAIRGGYEAAVRNVRYHFAACKLSLRLFRHEKQWLNVIFLTHSLYTLFFSIRCERES